ncbi:hypothetical protein TSUD_04610 [Trifolium subterraneum]|nr:hypothetical protein TSUD_04610 [Trifolium subterraneum]
MRKSRRELGRHKEGRVLPELYLKLQRQCHDQNKDKSRLKLWFVSIEQSISSLQTKPHGQNKP